MLTIAHLVSPVTGSERPDLAAVQERTFEAMRRAHRCAESSGCARVRLIAASRDGAAPAGFDGAPLERSVVDGRRFASHRPFPLLADLIARVRAPEPELCVFSNVDIAVSERFYSRVVELHRAGLDAFSINRRTVHATEPVALDWLVEQPGERHPGCDCFVFAPAILEGVDFGALCVGVPPVGAALAAALASRARSFRVLEEEHVTFHVGDDRPWRDAQLQDYWIHNRDEAAALLSRLASPDGALVPLAEALRRGVLTLPRITDF